MCLLSSKMSDEEGCFMIGVFGVILFTVGGVVFCVATLPSGDPGSDAVLAFVALIFFSPAIAYLAFLCHLLWKCLTHRVTVVQLDDDSEV